MALTRDYDRFKLLNLNRSLDRNHINKIKDSIVKNGYLMSNPIIVNKDMEILDGQHRFVALKDMGLEVPYEVIDKDYGTIIDLNTTAKSWTVEDYVNYYCQKDQNPNFLRLARLCVELKSSATNILTIAIGERPGGTFMNNVKHGVLKLTQVDENRINEFYTQMLAFCKMVKIKPSAKLSRALIKLSQHPRFSWKTMLEKAVKYPTLAYNCRTDDEFKIMLKDLYNYNTKKEELKL